MIIYLSKMVPFRLNIFILRFSKVCYYFIFFIIILMEIPSCWFCFICRWVLRAVFPKINQMLWQCQQRHLSMLAFGLKPSRGFLAARCPLTFPPRMRKGEVKHEVTFGELDLCSSGLFWPTLRKAGHVSFSERLFLIRSPDGSRLNCAVLFFSSFNARHGFTHQLLSLCIHPQRKINTL